MNPFVLLETVPVSSVYPIIRLVLLILIILCSLYMIYIVLIQPGNSSGIGALGGSTETFLSKNKSKTLESRRKRRTIMVAVILGVLLIAFAIISSISI